jgi:hypothetical protein
MTVASGVATELAGVATGNAAPADTTRPADTTFGAALDLAFGAGAGPSSS